MTSQFAFVTKMATTTRENAPDANPSAKNRLICDHKSQLRLTELVSFLLSSSLSSTTTRYGMASGDVCLARILLCLLFGPFGLICWPCVTGGGGQQQQMQQQQQSVIVLSGLPSSSSSGITIGNGATDGKHKEA